MIVLGIQDVIREIKKLAVRIKKDPLPASCPKYLVYGVPRGGVPVSMLLGAMYPDEFVAVDSSDSADAIVDDILDSGRTRDKWVAKTNLPFYPMWEKDSTEWVSFPWERTGDASPADQSSGEDIAVRLLEFIGEDIHREGLLKTPARFVKAWKHWTEGYSKDPMEYMQTFDDGAEETDQLVLLRNIPITSFCEHHLAPFIGFASVGYIPDKKIIGLSKISRVIDVFAHRLQVQERLTNQVANALSEGLAPLGVGVLIEATHTCMSTRGIHQSNIMTSTCALRGVFRTDAAARSEFLSAARGS